MSSNLEHRHIWEAMMFKRWLMLMLLIIAPTSAALAQDDLPPPLGFSSYDEYASGYQIYDFATGQIESVKRDETLAGPSFAVDPAPTAEITIASPSDPSVKFVFVSTVPPIANEQNDYSLYSLASDGTRQFLASHAAPLYPAPDYWSPNGDYFYFISDIQPSGFASLSQIDLRTMQRTPLKQQTTGINDCQSDTAWCIVREYGVRTDDTYPVTLYLLNRDDATLQLLGTSLLIFTNVMWLDASSQFLYAIATSTTEYAIHRFDAATGTDKRLAEIQAFFTNQWQRSPDNRWLLIPASLSKERFGGLYALDLQANGAEAILLTSDFTQLSQSSAASLRWLEDNTLIYTTRAKNDGYTIYRVTFPEGKIWPLVNFLPELGFFDHDWSPDGRWLVLSKYVYDDTPAALYLVSVDGELSIIPLPAAITQPICVGWFTLDDYLSQNADICDMHIGMG